MNEPTCSGCIYLTGRGITTGCHLHYYRPPGACLNLTHSPRTRSGPWACPDCDQPYLVDTYPN